MDPVSEPRVKVLPLLHAWAKQLQTAHPDVTVEVWDSTTGSLTPWQGHDVGIDCVFKGRDLDQSDNVALFVSLCHLGTEPMIDSADVVWGHPSGHLEASLLEGRIMISAEINE